MPDTIRQGREANSSMLESEAVEQHTMVKCTPDMAFLYKLRYGILVLTLLISGLLWPGVQTTLKVDNSLTVWFLQNDPTLNSYNRFKTQFGNDEVVIVMVHDSQTVLKPAYFRAFTTLSRALESNPDVASLIGPGNASLPTRDLLGTTLTPLLTDTSTTAILRNTLARHPTLRNQLFSPDYRTARFLITLKTSPHFDERRGAILDTLQTTVRAHISTGEVYFGGVGVIYAGLNTLSQKDFGFFLGIGYLIMFGLLWWIYRRPLLLIYTIGIVSTATYLTLGIYGTFGYHLNLMTVLLPIILVLLGVMDAVHVINERNQLTQSGLNEKDSALEALRRVFRPCLFTALTTASGFLALLTAPMAILQTFGLFAAIGIVLCLFFTFLLGVLILPYTQPSAQVTHVTGERLIRFLGLVLARKRLFWGVSALLIILSAVGISRLETDTYTLGYLPDDHPVVRDHEAMQHHWGPYMPLELLVQPKPGLSLHHPDLVREALRFGDSARTLPGVGRVFGFHSLYQAGLEGESGTRTDRALRSRSILQRVHDQLGKNYPDLTRSFVHESTQTGRITVSGSMVSARQLTAKLDSLLRIADHTLGRVATVTPAGYQPLYAGIVNYVTESQTNSLLLSFGLVFGLVWLFLRDAKLAALAVIPNLFPVLLMLGTMGWLGIRLDTATASIGAIVLSICTDDSIHFVYAYRQNRRAGMLPSMARQATVGHVGPAVVLTGVVLFVGFFLMVLGSLKTVQLWGLLTAIAIVAALFGELVLFPLVLSRFDRD